MDDEARNLCAAYAKEKFKGAAAGLWATRIGAPLSVLGFAAGHGAIGVAGLGAAVAGTALTMSLRTKGVSWLVAGYSRSRWAIDERIAFASRALRQPVSDQESAPQSATNVVQLSDYRQDRDQEAEHDR